MEVNDPDVWSSLITAANPASILVAIACRMGHDLRLRVAPDDIFQEALLKAWQARGELVWQGTPAFRRWLIRIAENCIEDQRDRAAAQKRRQARTVPLGGGGGYDVESHAEAGGPEPWTSTTPSRIASEREKASAMERALESLPEEVREVVRLRLFEDFLIEEVAAKLGLGESAVRHRFRRGAELFRDRLRELLPPSAIERG